MVPQIGDYVLVDGKVMHVQDRDCIQKIAKVGIPDNNGIVWSTKWVEWDKVTKFTVDG